MFRDVYGLWKQWIFVFMLLAGFLALTFGVDIPGCPKYVVACLLSGYKALYYIFMEDLFFFHKPSAKPVACGQRGIFLSFLSGRKTFKNAGYP